MDPCGKPRGHIVLKWTPNQADKWVTSISASLKTSDGDLGTPEEMS